MIERRVLPIADIEIRAEDGRPPVIRGYASVFDSESRDLGGFKEIVKPGAFRASLESRDDVLATVDHDPSKLLGRTAAGTLSLAEDARGLRFEVTPPDTSYARDLLTCMKRGDITGASFGFTIPDKKSGQAWRNENGQKIRELRAVRLLDVAVVTSPAYPDASAAMRSYDAWQEEITALFATARARLRLAEFVA